ncbi:MAG: hypothetical protein V1809_08985, partial [Planctomycetota bacterium]
MDLGLVWICMAFLVVLLFRVRARLKKIQQGQAEIIEKFSRVEKDFSRAAKAVESLAWRASFVSTAAATPAGATAAPPPVPVPSPVPPAAVPVPGATPAGGTAGMKPAPHPTVPPAVTVPKAGGAFVPEPPPVPRP